jgi:hypothetical protein
MPQAGEWWPVPIDAMEGKNVVDIDSARYTGAPGGRMTAARAPEPR